MSEPTKAVFLSYAREDTDAAKHIADALRAFGVEVWFDQSELRGGDSWDAKIRGQIKSCALFLPIISARTEERSEGYFRREWKLAVDRTHDMAGGRSFIVPIVIDDTNETAAAVPEEFMRFQWTRLPNGEATPDFVTQVKRLLEPQKKPVLKPDLPRPPTLPPEFRQAARGQKSEDGGQRTDGRKSSPPAALWISLGVVFACVGVVFFVLRPKSPPPLGVQRSTLSVERSAPPALPAAAVRDAKSIAVLPFANLSADKENEFFADGMHDDLITALAKIRDLKVISRTSVMPYKTGERNLKKIAAELGVATVLEGSVQRAGNRVRLNVQLIDASTDGHLWAETYNKDLTDVFTIQAALAEEITTALKASLTAGERTLLARRPTENQAAYDLYLRARVLDQNLSIASTREAYESVIALYDQAAAADPKFALPHVQASILHGTLYWFGSLDATPARRARVEAELEAAKRLAPDAPETYLAQGSFDYTCRNDWAKSIVEYRKAEAGLPNDAQLQYRIGIAHRRLGQMEEAQRRFEISVTLNPNDLNAVATYFDNLLAMRHYRQLVAEIVRFEAIFPAERRLQTSRLRALYELDGNRSAFRRDMAALPPAAADPHGLQAAFAAAMDVGDLAAAEKVLEDPRMTGINDAGRAINYPVELARASLAWLRGRPEDARRFADEAIANIRSRKWAPRQEPGAQMGIAHAEAFAGRHEEALRDARSALADQVARDVYAGATMQDDLGRILVVCNQREEALAVLRTYLAGIGGPTPNAIRYDPIWSRLKDDPRFEEILRSAKPL